MVRKVTRRVAEPGNMAREIKAAKRVNHFRLNDTEHKVLTCALMGKLERRKFQQDWVEETRFYMGDRDVSPIVRRLVVHDILTSRSRFEDGAVVPNMRYVENFEPGSLFDAVQAD